MAMPTGVLAREAQQPAGNEMAPPAKPAKGAAKAPDERTKELFNLVVSRVREALARQGRDLDVGLKADPVGAAVQFGTLAVRSVVQAAQQAGKALPVEIIIAAGMQTVKDLAEIANDKGYLPDDGIETFMKEVFQQSIQQYAQADKEEGIGPGGTPTPTRAPPPQGVLAQQGAM